MSTEVVVPVALASAELGGGTVGHYAIEPRAEERLAAEAAEALVGPQIRLLNHVSSILRVAREAQGQRVRVGVGDPHEPVERLPVAGLGPLYERNHVRRGLRLAIGADVTR